MLNPNFTWASKIQAYARPTPKQTQHKITLFLLLGVVDLGLTQPKLHPCSVECVKLTPSPRVREREREGGRGVWIKRASKAPMRREKIQSQTL